ncbi:uncharacterized protein MYCFIDRAFT_173173 [Pseudocercospora fijiensis CIRAD86]|uniref:Uncharacterized protein n=1 Tax=Pseudocercospora fijiensis (strain CIRAD86) TaxID=383855 RepID=M2ZYV2_PSEFD|nr:uncharacterized protein MYCFIDRAFT_173173 [Pseudocercospora fijiensis CIRAD86]EME84124.1 hypothetical protein MYCFIDRAFT_173173 [Pseudocercospora fijiensis CIRAD86]
MCSRTDVCSDNAGTTGAPHSSVPCCTSPSAGAAVKLGWTGLEAPQDPRLPRARLLSVVAFRPNNSRSDASVPEVPGASQRRRPREPNLSHAGSNFPITSSFCDSQELTSLFIHRKNRESDFENTFASRQGASAAARPTYLRYNRSYDRHVVTLHKGLEILFKDLSSRLAWGTCGGFVDIQYHSSSETLSDRCYSAIRCIVVRHLLHHRYALTSACKHCSIPSNMHRSRWTTFQVTMIRKHKGFLRFLASRHPMDNIRSRNDQKAHDPISERETSRCRSNIPNMKTSSGYFTSESQCPHTRFERKADFQPDEMTSAGHWNVIWMGRSETPRGD